MLQAISCDFSQGFEHLLAVGSYIVFDDRQNLSPR